MAVAVAVEVAAAAVAAVVAAITTTTTTSSVASVSTASPGVGTAVHDIVSHISSPPARVLASTIELR